MYKNILVPIDMEQLPNGEKLAETLLADGDINSQFILLNVIEEVPSWVAAGLPDRSELLAQSKKYAREQLSNIASSANIHARIEVRIGHPYQTILNAAEEFQADLIIVTAHQPGLQDYLLGSTSDKVVRHAKCAVLVVR
jgi:universal stress protein F